MSLRVLIVGLGQIGMGYDLLHDPEKIISTHARSFQMHPEYVLIGGVDTSEVRLRAFESEYGCPGYNNLDVALQEQNPEIVIIATPTELHKNTLFEVLVHCKPKAIICEKPLSYDLTEAEEMVSHCEEEGVSLFINFMRRSDRGVIEVKARIQSGAIMQPIKGVCWYSKGILNNGSHFINLLQFWLGRVINVEVMSPGRLWDNKDPEPDLKLEFELGSIYFLAAQEENYSHYTIELICSNGRLQYEQGGEKIYWQQVVEDTACDGYQILNSKVEVIESDMNLIQLQLASQLAAQLGGEDAQICSAHEALETQKILDIIAKAL